MRIAWLLTATALVATGCSFTGASPAPSDDPADAALDGRGADGPAPVAVCDEPDLAGCWEFEGDADDGSGNENHGSMMNGADFDPSGIVGDAVLLDGVDDFVLIPEAESLDAEALTLEAWINPAAYPGGGNEGVVADNDSQYAIAITGGDGRVRCTAAGGPELTPEATALLDEWSHLACTVDATRVRLFLDGDEVDCGPRSDPARTDGENGTAFAANLADGGPSIGFFAGRLDNLRIFSAVRSPAEICAAAGRSECAVLDVEDCN